MGAALKQSDMHGRPGIREWACKTLKTRSLMEKCLADRLAFPT